MKYLFIFLISFTLFSPAYAAKTVSGTVPKLAPLQPVPFGVSPNFSKNIESSAPNPSANEPDSSAGAQNASQSSGKNSTSQGSGSAAAGPNFLVLLALIILGAAALTWVWLRRGKA
jgi:hypothetical protein